MAVQAVKLSPAVSSNLKLVEAPEKQEVKQPMSKAKKAGIAIASVCLTAAAVAGIALAVKKGQAKKAAALPKDFVLGENGVKTLFGKINAKAMDKQIAEVAERTSEAGVSRWLEHFGEGAEHVAQKVSIVG